MIMPTMLTRCGRHVRVHHADKDKDDPLLRDVLSQRPLEKPSRGRRRRSERMREGGGHATVNSIHKTVTSNEAGKKEADFKNHENAERTDVEVLKTGGPQPESSADYDSKENKQAVVKTVKVAVSDDDVHGIDTTSFVDFSEYDRFQALNSPGEGVELGKRARKQKVNLSALEHDTQPTGLNDLLMKEDEEQDDNSFFGGQDDDSLFGEHDGNNLWGKLDGDDLWTSKTRDEDIFNLKVLQQTPDIAQQVHTKTPFRLMNRMI